MNNNYLNFLKNPNGHNMDVMSERFNHIIDKIDPTTISVLLEIGSMDAWESINMARIFEDATIYTFEPVPYNISRCKENIANHPNVANRIFLQEMAVNDVTGPMTFWALDIEAASIKGRLNHGIGSKFKILDPDMWYWEHNQQKSIDVNGYKLDDWCADNSINTVDGIWMDAQGSELDILRGAANTLNNVRFIITEAGLIPYYDGHTMKSDIDNFLFSKGFIEYKSATRTAHKFEADVIYINEKLMNKVLND